MDTPSSALASLARRLPSFTLGCSLVILSVPAAAQRARGPSGATAQGISLACPPDFIGQQLGFGLRPEEFALVDLDGDGDLDLALSNRYPGTITTVFQQGGQFEAGGTYPLSGDPDRIVASDVDGNGSADLVVSMRSNGTEIPTVAVLSNQGGGVFATPIEYPTGPDTWPVWPSSLALADLDGDGDRDLAVANLSTQFTTSGDVLEDTSVAVLLNAGNGTFGAPSVTPLGPPDSSPGELLEESFVVADDFDGDGDADLAVSVAGEDALYVLLNQGAGVFNLSAPYVVGSQPGALVAADLDGDGDRDLAAVKVHANSFAVLLNQGNGTFAPALSQAGRHDSHSLALGDLDADGDADLAFTTLETYWLSVSIALNQGNGSFDPPVDLRAHVRPNALASGDLDGNGTIDLASVNGQTIALLRNLGNAAFETAPSYAAGNNPKLVANADLDGDGDRDLVVGSGTLTKVSVLGNLGHGVFAPPVEYVGGNRPAAMTIADLDHDGRVDLVTAGGSQAQVRMNQGGTLGSLATFGLGSTANGVTSADLDGDGDLDLALSLASQSTLGILPGLGNGSFGAALTFPQGFTATGITGGDFDRDGDVDLGLVARGTKSTRVFDNQGAGTFALAESHFTSAAPVAITSADFDRDGRADLAILLEFGGTGLGANVGVLQNQGNGTFGTPALSPVGYEALGFLSADLDRDAGPDLIVATEQTRALCLLMNRGDGTFAPEQRVTAGWTMGLTCADLDGDGDMDLASSELESDSVWIHLNRCR